MFEKKAFPSCKHTPQKYTGPSFEEVKKVSDTNLSQSLLRFYKQPLLIVEGNMQYLYDEKGARYLDLFGGIVTVSVGHCHPRINAALEKQMKKLWHTTCIYYTQEMADYAKMLASKMPGKLKVCIFTNSGSESTELALQLARLYTGNNDVVCVRNSYHGGSSNAISVTNNSSWKYPLVGGHSIVQSLNPDTYRGLFTDKDAGLKYANDVKEVIKFCTSGRVAGFIAETIQGVGGTVELPDGYLPEVYKSIREAGGVCIADEVQTGFGRCGSHYWGFETKGVIPDIVTMAKGIGNGFPIGCVVTTEEIASKLKQKIHFNTFGGNPLACVVGMEVLKIIEDEGLQKNAQELGLRFREGFLKLKDKYEIVGDIKGKGLMMGIEFVKCKKTKEPAKEETAMVFEKLKEMNILVGKGGILGNVLRIKPPMCINKDDVDYTLYALDKILGEMSQKK